MNARYNIHEAYSPRFEGLEEPAASAVTLAIGNTSGCYTFFGCFFYKQFFTINSGFKCKASMLLSPGRTKSTSSPEGCFHEVITPPKR